MLNITREQFNTLFHQVSNSDELFNTVSGRPANAKELFVKYLRSKLWRLNNLYTIIDKQANLCTFKMNYAQFYVYSHLYTHKRLIILKSRQRGISTLWLVSFFDDCLFIPNLYCGLMAQGKDEANKLLERIKIMRDHLNPVILKFLDRKIIKDNTLEVAFNNGSNIFIRTSFRSATLHRLHISEYGKIANESPKRAKETKTGTLQTLAPGNIGVIESTADGHNDFKLLWDLANEQKPGSLASKDFLPIFLSWLDDPSCLEDKHQEDTEESKEYFNYLLGQGKQVNQKQKNFWIMQSRELSGDIHQEYPATPEEAFQSARDGTYWSRKYIKDVLNRNRRQSNLYDPNLPVYIIFDLGHGDYTVLLFVQFWYNIKKEWEIRIVDNYYNCGEDLRHYCTYIKTIKNKENYAIKQLVLPHDALVVELTANNKTREQIIHEEGLTNTIILKKSDLLEGIELVRNHTELFYIDKKCNYIHECFLYYTKEWNEQLKVWKDQPKRNQYSHGADTVRYCLQYFNQYINNVHDYRSISNSLKL